MCLAHVQYDIDQEEIDRKSVTAELFTLLKKVEWVGYPVLSHIEDSPK